MGRGALGMGCGAWGWRREAGCVRRGAWGWGVCVICELTLV